MSFSTAEIQALKSLIEFHTESFTDDESADELNELLGTDIETLYDKVCSLDESSN